MFEKIFKSNREWQELIPRLVEPGILNISEKNRLRIMKL